MIRKPTRTIFEVETAGEQKPVVDKRTEMKEFVCTRQPNGLYSVKFTAGGEVPDSLKGLFTSGSRAEQAAQAYLLTHRAKTAS